MSIIDTSLAAEMLENRLKGLNKFIDRWDMVWYYVTIMKAGFGVTIGLGREDWDA